MTITTASALSASALSGLPLSGLRVVVTGDVPGMTRDAAQEAVRMMGGTSVGSVTPSTDLLVVGKGAGAAKLAKAAARSLPLLPAEEFALLAENPDRWDGTPLGEPSGPERVPDVPVRRHRPALLHPAGETAWTRQGSWVVVKSCLCGYRSEGATRDEAEALHRAHQVALGDLDADAG